MAILTIVIIYSLIGGIFLHFWGEKGVTGLNLFCVLGWPLIIFIIGVASFFLMIHNNSDNLEI